jgi:AraC-like DNA-binding protein
MALDRLDALLQRFSFDTRMFNAGALCGTNDFAPEPGLGQLHLVRRGRVDITHAGSRDVINVDGPCLLFYPRPMAHRFVTDATVGADLVCAHVRFNQGVGSPLADALPAFVTMPLAELDGTAALLEILFDEAFGHQCGRRSVVNRLFEVVLIQILRQLLQAGRVDVGLLAGLAHPQLARSLVAMHERPARTWSLETLAGEAGLSRSAFASTFRKTVGITPGDYLGQWRVSLAQDLLRKGRSLKRIVDEVGYGSEAALSRAFKAYCGVSPREWKRADAA